MDQKRRKSNLEKQAAFETNAENRRHFQSDRAALDSPKIRA